VGELLRRRLSEVLARGEVHDPELNAISITVGEVRAAPDLKTATAWVMPLGGRDAAHALAVLTRNRGEIRRAVVKGLELKYAPEFRFVARRDLRPDRRDPPPLLGRDRAARHRVVMRGLAFAAALLAAPAMASDCRT
jgi:ribosome-binding factor A